MNDATATDDDGDLSPYVPGGSGDPRRRRRSGAKAAAAGGLVVALVAGVLALASLTSDGGTGTPEDAARTLIEAVAAEDVLGALEALVPAEREVLRDRLVDIVGELGRLGVLADVVDLGEVPGADIAVDGLELRSEALSEDVASVLVVGGEATLSLAVDALPLGPLVKQSAGRVGSPSPESTELGGDDDMRLVAVRHDGDWFVSLGYTFAEAARRNAGAPVPHFAMAVQPRGEASPEAVVRALADAVSEYDARRVVELTAPGEAAALHAYAPLFLDALDAKGAELRNDQRSTGVSGLELSSAESGDEAHVTIDRVEVNINDDRDPVTFEYDGKCVTEIGKIGSPDRSVLCADDPSLGALAGTPLAGTTLTVVRRAGLWYLSPVGTYIDATLATLRALDRSDVEAAIDEGGPEAAMSIVSPFLNVFLAVVRNSYGAPVGHSSDAGCWFGYDEKSPPPTFDPTECDPSAMLPLPVAPPPLRAPPASASTARDLPATQPAPDPIGTAPTTTNP